GECLDLSETLGRNLFEATAHKDSTQDQGAGSAQQQQQPPPMLHGMPQDPQKMAPIVARNERDAKISCCPGQCDQAQESSHWITGSPGSGKEQTGGHGQRDGRGCNQGSCAPALKQFQELRQPASLESALQIRRTGGAREAEGDVCPDDRTCGRRSGEFVPERTVASGENRGQDVRA